MRLKDAQAVRALRSKVAGTSITNESPKKSSMDTMMTYQTNSAMVHRNQGEINVVSKEQRLAQKTKLTQANFNMGKSPPFYSTTNKNAFVPMVCQVASIEQRKESMDRNRRTNFISQNNSGFEDPPKRYSFAAVPDKGANDSSAVKGMIDNLRKEHFKLGEQNSGMYRSSASYGQGV